MRIESIQIKHITEEQPDLSWLGEYSDTPAEHHIDRSEQGFWSSREFRYFNLGAGNAEYLQRDYERMEAYNNQQWCSMGIVAEATVSYSIGHSQAQHHRRLETLSSGGLWGIESDSSDYVEIIENDELADLREHLEHFGIKCSDTDWQELCEQAKQAICQP